MKKIKDRHILGIFAGLCGTAAKILVDEISLSQKISKSSYRETAAGVWVNSRREAKSWRGNLLGSIMDAGLGCMGAVFKLNMLSKHGRDHVLMKGLFFGSAYGAVISALLSGFSNNKIKPQDAASNLSYVFANAVYGIVTTYCLCKFGDDSLFDSEPINDRIKPSRKTTEETKIADQAQHPQQLQHTRQPQALRQLPESRPLQ